MCLITTSTVQIAKTDIYVIKLLRSYNFTGYYSYYSYYRGNKYEMNTFYSFKMGLKKDINDDVNLGCHSFYVNLNKTNKFFGGSGGGYWKESVRTIVCKIPAGSKFYFGRDSDIVSNQIILLEDITDKIIKPHTSKILIINVINRGFDYIKNNY